MKIYRCSKCGRLFESLTDKVEKCCGKSMELLTANSVDASQEKHLPVVEVVGNEVYIKVGSTIHPMTEEHYIEKIMLETDNKIYSQQLTPKDKPEMHIKGFEGKIIAAYAYCNLHGLWKTEL